MDGNLIASDIIVGWINYLFQEHYRQKINDPWVFFEALHEQMDIDLDGYNGSRLGLWQKEIIVCINRKFYRK